MFRMTPWLCVLSLVCWLPVWSPAAPPRRPVGTILTDEAVEKAVAGAVKYLWSQQEANGSFSSGTNGGYPFGASSLATYALLASGESHQSDRMLKALAFLAADKGPDGKPCSKTYSLGLRANVWLLADRKTGKGLDRTRSRGKYRKYLIRDAEKLYKSTKDGSYGYGSLGLGRSSGDNSNSQYGLLGVWAAALANVEVPMRYWQLVMKHWVGCQDGSGGWGYRGPGATKGTMTAAGVASLYVCFDNLYYKQFIACKGETDFAPIKRGLDWLEKNFGGGGGWGGGGYYLYGIERVGLASGYKYFGKVDWYKSGATGILKTQRPDGGWGSLVETSFRLLFLSRGRHPVPFNKLQFDGDWNNRPRDLAGLTRWARGIFERPMNWQIISLKAPVREWHDAPLLYISGAKKPTFSDGDIEKLRQYVHQGGTIFTVTECSGTAFRKGMRDLYTKLFPNYELTRCGPDHPIYSKELGHFPLRGRPSFWIVSNGVRPLVIHADEDLAKAWQLRTYRTQRHAFEGPINALVYVADSIKSLRSRGVSHWPEAPTGDRASKTVKLARLQYNGNYDPEPLATRRFALMMARETKTRIEAVGPIKIADLASSGAKVATLTGTGRLRLTAAEQAALQAYVAGGGTLVIDAAGGNEAFADSARATLAEMYGQDALGRLSLLSPIYRLAGMELKRVRYRNRTYKRVRTVEPRLRAVLVNERPGVIFSGEDLTAGLVGCSGRAIEGYEPRSAFLLMRNIVLTATAEAPKGKPTAPKRP